MVFFLSIPKQCDFEQYEKQQKKHHSKAAAHEFFKNVNLSKNVSLSKQGRNWTFILYFTMSKIVSNYIESSVISEFGL